MTEIDTRTWRVLARLEQDVLDLIRAGITVQIDGVTFASPPCVWCATSPIVVRVVLERGRRPRWTCAMCRRPIPLSIDATS